MKQFFNVHRLPFLFFQTFKLRKSLISFLYLKLPKRIAKVLLTCNILSIFYASKDVTTHFI